MSTSSPWRAPVRRRWLIVGSLAGLCVLTAGAGAGAALESDTVGSFGQGLLWAVTLMTTAGFLHGPPETVAGSFVAVALMVTGFLLLSLASAALAAVFIREDVQSSERLEERRDDELLRRLEEISARLAALEQAQRER
ncbi:hypothetical protein G5V58_14685 [Nocardioides anomalus]|uniref:Potassium channel domain-containing protein n=1 Tax=Nocardioides anomalus TaxID=2712223 RepID=A0A6G6WF59_9ACTN|nr:ion channel [Nocardioides anomalus]QIG43849.1 hypothetical protein G5V58_14685 [Nocardioides anomalus]